MPKRALKILLLAGEQSGVVYASRLRAELENAAGGRGIEWRSYESEGFAVADLAVMGFWPVVRRLGYFLRVKRTMKKLIREWRPDAVVGVDYPGMNLRLEAAAKALGIPAIHLVCPQVWAWRRGRIPGIAASLTKLLCFFPFEPELFAGTGLDAKFIGHPLVDIAKEEASRAGRRGERRVLALLPGSRTGEIERNLPRLLGAASLLARKFALDVQIPAANARAETMIAAALRRAEFRDLAALVTVSRGNAREILRSADAAAVASGTATLEAALAGCPTALVYAVSPAFAWFVRHFVKGTRFIGLANIVADRAGLPPPMPEILQEAFTPEAVAAAVGGWLEGGPERDRAVAALDRVMRELGAGSGALALAAKEVLECVSK